jgi:hypothetical protein
VGARVAQCRRSSFAKSENAFTFAPRLTGPLASAKAAKAEKSINDQLHAQNYLVYAYLQLGQFSDSRPRGRSTLTIAFNDHCDALVDTVGTGHNRPAELEPVVLEFLNWDTVIHWAEVTLGL